MNHAPFVVLRRTEWLALLLLGLMAGFFFSFAVDVAPAMASLDAATYIAAQQSINRVVRNAVFGGVYFGSALLPWLAAGAALWAGWQRRALRWALIALVYGAAVFWLTRSVNVPINDALAAWDPQHPPADWQAARGRWNEANLVRAWASAACFAAAAWTRSG
ncbi:MAG: DUF1772 domain-containing protein [Burkholderiales bacterium]|nr:DUF1772 domain-containing protein [Burkholderiales bacterium]MBK8665675.1 DUF1772 domain-containing protein [Burkholderiales bacterium]